MAEICERRVAAHGVTILAPTCWYQSPSPLKLMVDRMVCADGGNPDPGATHGKNVAEAKRIEQAGWDDPKHMAGRVYGVVVRGCVARVEVHRRNLTGRSNGHGRSNRGDWPESSSQSHSSGYSFGVARPSWVDAM